MSLTNILVYFVPQALLAEIFSQLLSLEDLCRFDSAICNIKRRQLFLDCIGSESCIFLGNKNQYFGSDTISWLYTRSLKIRHLKCDRVCTDTAAQICSFGRTLHWLSIKDRHLTHYSLDMIVSACPNLQSLELLECGFGLLGSINDYSVIRIVEECPHLRSLDLTWNTNITDKSIVKLAEKCPKLLNLNLANCHDVTDKSIFKIADCCYDLQSFDISSQLNDYGHMDITDISIIRLVENCPNLKNLNISYCHNISDLSINRLAENCSKLQILKVRGCKKVTNASMIKLVDRCHTLKELYVDNCNIDGTSYGRFSKERPDLRIKLLIL